MSFWIKLSIWLNACLFALLTVGCLTMQNAPISHLYVIDVQNNICSKRVITNKSSLASKWVEDLPLEACDGNVSLTAKEFLDLKTYLRGKK